MCAYQHVTKSTNPNVEKIENEIQHLREEIDILRLNVSEIMRKFNSRDSYDEHTERHEVQIKWEKCDFRCKNETTLRKHINTKHAV